MLSSVAVDNRIIAVSEAVDLSAEARRRRLSGLSALRHQRAQRVADQAVTSPSRGSVTG
jgi:hypothetical protein